VLRLDADGGAILVSEPSRVRTRKPITLRTDHDEPVFLAVPIPSGVCYAPSESISVLHPTIRAAHDEFIAAAAARKKGSPFRAYFSPGVVDYLERTLRTSLPRPSYFDQRLLPAKPQRPSTVGAGFGQGERNREVERAAIDTASQWYRSRGWRVTSVEAEGCGYDLLCERRGRQLHVEVKGVAGMECQFIMTRGELRTALQDDDFVLALVRSALGNDRRIDLWSARRFRREARPDPIQYSVLLTTEDGSQKRGRG
jgi:hypothetical protein